MAQSRLVAWETEGETFEGKLFLPDGPAKGSVLVSHAWGGRAEHEEGFAERLAGNGYAAMAGDVYGKGVRGSNNEECEKLMTPLVQDRERLQGRLRANLAAMSAEPDVDGTKMAAAGFCFGGLCVLDLARTLAPVHGVAAFHALVGAAGDAPAGKIEAQVIAFQGFDDPMAGAEDLKTFSEEMTQRGAPWQLHTFGGVAHSFTNEGANMPEMGLIFDAKARDRSYRLFDQFLEELF